MPDDALTSLLKAAPLTELQRADAWEAFTQAQSTDELTAILRSLPIPQEVKADLWELKSSDTPAPRRDTLSGIDVRGSANAGAGTGVEKKRERVGRSLSLPEKVLTTALDTYTDVNIGAAKSLGNTAVGAANIMSSLPVAGDAIEYANEALYGLTPAQQQAQRDYVANVDLAASTGAQTAGKIGMDMVQMIAPGNAVNRLGLAAASRMPLGLKVASRLGVEAAGGAGMARLQNQDPTLGAAFGAGGAVVGAGLSRAGQFFAKPMSEPLQRAVEFAEARGVPLDWATMTGNQFLRRAQNFLGKATIGGAAVQEAAERARQVAFQRVGREVADSIHPAEMAGQEAGQAVQDTARQLAARQYDTVATQVFPQPVTTVEAGKATEGALVSGAKARSKAAGEQYGIVRQAQADNVAMVDQARQSRGDVFQWDEKSRGDLFAKAWEDAQRQGFPPDRAEEFRALLNERWASAKALIQETSANDGDRRLLQFIADNGGVGVAEKDLSGEAARLREMVTPARPNVRPDGAVGGVKGVVRPNAGLTADQMMERLRADPEFAEAFRDLPDSELFSIIEDAALHAGKGVVTAPEALAQAGVRPGVPWWADEASGVVDDLGHVGGKPVPVGLPTDVTGFKAKFGPMVEEELRAIRAASGTSDPALVALKQMLDGPDVVPWSVAERNLGLFKKYARTGNTPGLTTPSQRLASMAVEEIETAVQAALKDTPEAAQALSRGRALVKEAHELSGLLKALGAGKKTTEGVKVFRKLVAPKDANVSLLEGVVQEIGPDEALKLGRAWLDDATGALESTKVNDPGLARSAVDSFDVLGARTKRMLFGDDQVVKTVRDGLDRRASWLEAATGTDGKRDPKLLYDALISPNDGGMKELRGIPASERVKVGRAFLDQLLADAAQKAGTRAESAVWNSWLRMSPDKRKLLVPDPQVRQNFDDLALLGVRTSEDMNPSGSGFMLGMAEYMRAVPKILVGGGATGGIAGGFGAASLIAIASGLGVEVVALATNRMLHSPKAMALVRRITSTPPERVAQSTMLARQLSGLIGADVTVHPAAAPAGPSEKERR